MKTFLDTTYFIPSIGVILNGIPWDVAFRVNKKTETQISNLSLFEISAKGAKLVQNGLTTKEKVLKGVTSLNLDDRFQKVDFTDPLIQDTAITLRGRIKDYLDCLILASAIHTSQLMLTEDKIIKRVAEESKEIIQGINPDFRVRSWTQVEEEY
ncbi:MAG: PIN domain-containing protein [Candidatus Bathyarchaeota archaeon]|nr:PIN domain-containing protein [Candidatus Bathyarchaeota archaeon]